MGDIINLRQVRKQKARLEKAARADENRIRFGRAKADRMKVSAEKALEVRRLDGAKRRGPDEP